MFSRFPDVFIRNTAVRLTLWFLVTFVMSAAVLCVIIIHEIEKGIARRDLAMMTEKLTGYQNTDRLGGPSALYALLAKEDAANRATGFFVAVTDPDGRLAFLTLPGMVAEVDMGALDGKNSKNGWQPLPHTLKDAAKEPPSETVLTVIKGDRKGEGPLWVGRLRDEKAVSRWFREIFFKVLGLGILVAGIGGGILAQRTLRPLRDLVTTLEHLEAGKENARAPEGGNGYEFDALAKMFNRMLSRIDRLVTGMREALDHVAHDLRTPLARMQARIEMVMDGGGDQETFSDALLDCAEEADRMGRMLTLLLDISEAETGTMYLDTEQVRVLSVSEDVLHLYSCLAEEKAISLALDIPEDLFVTADRGRLSQMLANLVDNAIKYTPEGGLVRIRGASGENGVEIRVEDTGCGICESEQERIFERLYRADKSRHQKGFGLGLSLVRAIATAHGGSISVTSGTGGTVFLLVLPTG